MGLYRRSWRDKDGEVHSSKVWWINLMIDGQQHLESTGVTNRRTAQKILDLRRAAIAEGRFDLLKKQTPKLHDWAEKYLKSVQHPSTRRRYRYPKRT